MYRELLIGCGSSREKRIHCPVEGGHLWSNLMTLDNNPDHKPDILWDLEKLPLPFPTDYFDEIHAYEVLEHTGQQGDWRFFFDQFTEFHRILKPDGLFMATVPHHLSMWAWGDPSHKRVIASGSLVFLSQEEYRKQVGKTPMSDFRFYYKADFAILHSQENPDTMFFILKALKKDLPGT